MVIYRPWDIPLHRNSSLSAAATLFQTSDFPVLSSSDQIWKYFVRLAKF